MKQISNTFRKYNLPETLLVVTSYPEKGVKYSDKVCAVGGFAKNTLEGMKKEWGARGEQKSLVILTVQTGETNEIYEENGALIIRCIKRNSPRSFLGLIRFLVKFNKVREVLWEFEFASFGGVKMSLGSLFTLWFLGLWGKKIVLVLHQVVFDLASLSGHVGMKKRSLKLSFFEQGLKGFYRLLCLPVYKVVVLEQEFLNRLGAVVTKEKIEVIPHGVDGNLQPINKCLARKSLGIGDNEKVVLYFGYLTWYKGVDWLIENLGGKGLRLIVAGGPSFTQKDKEHYKKFYGKVLELAKEKKVEVTGFLPEDKIKTYFSACDMLVLPYRTFMSSSGPLSMAIAYNRPFMVSKPMNRILNTGDFREALVESGLTASDVVFDLKREAYGKLVKRLNDKDLMKKLAKLASLMKDKRDFYNLAGKYVRSWEEAAIGKRESVQPVTNFEPVVG